MHKKQLLLRPYKEMINIDDVLVKFFFRTNGKFANIFNYKSFDELYSMNMKNIVSVPVSNLYSCSFFEDKNGQKKNLFEKKILLKKYTEVVKKNFTLKFLFSLLKMDFPEKHYALLSMVNAYTAFGGQTKNNFLQLEFSGEKSDNFFNETVSNIINRINSEGIIMQTKKGYIFLGTEILTQDVWEELMDKAVTLNGTNEKVIKVQIFKGFSWMRITYREDGKQIKGIAEIISDTNL